ncbi:hypothetical protein MBANPS3_011364 [Mucor bainieri]
MTTLNENPNTLSLKVKNIQTSINANNKNLQDLKPDMKEFMKLMGLTLPAKEVVNAPLMQRIHEEVLSNAFTVANLAQPDAFGERRISLDDCKKQLKQDKNSGTSEQDNDKRPPTPKPLIMMFIQKVCQLEDKEATREASNETRRNDNQQQQPLEQHHSTASDLVYQQQVYHIYQAITRCRLETIFKKHPEFQLHSWHDVTKANGTYAMNQELTLEKDLRTYRIHLATDAFLARSLLTEAIRSPDPDEELYETDEKYPSDFCANDSSSDVHPEEEEIQEESIITNIEQEYQGREENCSHASDSQQQDTLNQHSPDNSEDDQCSAAPSPTMRDNHDQQSATQRRQSRSPSLRSSHSPPTSPETLTLTSIENNIVWDERNTTQGKKKKRGKPRKHLPTDNLRKSGKFKKQKTKPSMTN